MDPISGIPLTKAVLILGLCFAVTEGRPGTNFAGSSITSDSSGTRSSHLVGTIPDNSQLSDPSTRIYTSRNPSGGGDGATILTTRNGGAAVLTGTSSNGGGGVGVLSSSGGPSTRGGTQYSVISNQPQPSVLGRFGSQPSTGYAGSGAGFGGVGTGAYSGSGGAYSGAYAGPGGASAGAFAGPVQESNYDYYG